LVDQASRSTTRCLDLPVYLRVTQADGHQAWSSPICLGDLALGRQNRPIDLQCRVAADGCAFLALSKPRAIGISEIDR
jgi:hypothetical protein